LLLLASMFLQVVFLSLLFVDIQGAGITFRKLAIDSATFTDGVSGLVSGIIYEGPLSAIQQIFYLGNDVTLTQGYTVRNLTSATTLTFAVSFRDLTLMPTVSIDQMYATIVNGNCMHSLTSSLLALGNGGAASASVNGTFPLGSLDSYNNLIRQGDLMALDWGVFIDAPTLHQNVTINLYGQTQSFVLF